MRALSCGYGDRGHQGRMRRRLLPVRLWRAGLLLREVQAGGEAMSESGAPIRTLRQLWVPWSVIAPQREADSLAVAAFPLGFATCKPWFELVVVPACDDLWQYRIQYHDASRLHAVPDIVSRDYDSQRAAQVAAEDDWASLCEERGYPRLSEQQIAEREMPCGLPACNRRTISARSKSFVRTLLDGDIPR